MKLFKGISKISTLVLQIALVIAVVLVFSWFDPFELLAPTKKTLKDTPIQLRSIREIGELSTAEYYGEVIASLDEVLDEEAIEMVEEFTTDITRLHESFRTAINELAEQDLKRSEVYAAFADNYPDVAEHQAFRNYMYFIDQQLADKRFRPNELDNTLSNRKAEKLIRELARGRNNSQRTTLANVDIGALRNIYESETEDALKKRRRHSRLVLLGRGWVKAGFDFSDFNERNFIYDKDRKRIFILGMQPRILSTVINPWFIPEEGVEGFEFVVVERRVRLKPELTIKVKQRCLDKLQQQALDKQLLTKARENAEEHLKALFSILLDDEEFKGVYFYSSYLKYTVDVLLEDSQLRNEELLSVDTILSTHLQQTHEAMDDGELSTFIDTLRKTPAQIYGSSIRSGMYASSLFKIVKDRRIDLNDSLYFREVNSVSVLDSVWLAGIPDENKQRVIEQDHLNFILDLKKLADELDIWVVDSTMLGL